VSIAAVFALAISCDGRHQSPRATFEHAEQAFLHGQLDHSHDEAERGYQRFRNSSPEWALKFRILEAKAALWQGLYEDVLSLLSSESVPADQPDLAISMLTLVGVANVNTHNFTEAERSLGDASKLCATSVLASCGYVLQARGLLASERAQSTSAEEFYDLSLAFARSHGDSFLESDSLLNLGAESLSQERYDEAIDRSQAAYQAAKAADAEAAMAKAKDAWGSMSTDVPKMVAALQSRVDMLSKSHHLPAGVTKDSLASAKSGLDSIKSAWSDASAAAGSGDFATAMTKASAVKDQATALMQSLGMTSG